MTAITGMSFRYSVRPGERAEEAKKNISDNKVQLLNLVGHFKNYRYCGLEKKEDLTPMLSRGCSADATVDEISVVLKNLVRYVVRD